MDKLTLAHDWVMKFGEPTYINGSVEQAWNYADAMLEEAEKRQDKTLPDALWQPDWSLAPDWAKWWSMDSNSHANWYSKSPRIQEGFKFWIRPELFRTAPNFGYTGDWRNSIRIRPSSK